MKLDEVASIATSYAGVRQTSVEGLLQWRFHGRLVVRQLDPSHLVIRAEFDVREGLVDRHPKTFSVPTRFAQHMMVVANLAGDPSAIEDAIEAAWELQRRSS
jgi:hypothetical protein